MSEQRGILSRRSLLELGGRALTAAGVAAAVPDWAQAGSTRGGALVCVYLFGGNDGHNMIVPLDSAAYDSYARVRGELALPADSLLPVTAAGQARYGLHPALSELQELFNARALSVVADVGDPMRLERGHSYEGLAFVPGGYALPGWAAAAAGITPTDMKGRVDTLDSGAVALSMDGHKRGGAKPPLRTRFPETSLGRQMRQIAGLIGDGSRRQVFFASLSGFDTHYQQMERQSGLFRELSQALGAFYQATVEMGVAQQVTTFTDSEFGRSLAPNAAHGSDHGWGNHQIVMGGAVLGGEVYGEFPVPSASARRPSTFSGQYHATLARWSGYEYADLPGMFPAVDALAPRTLAFLS